MYRHAAASSARTSLKRRRHRLLVVTPPVSVATSTARGCGNDCASFRWRGRRWQKQPLLHHHTTACVSIVPSRSYSSSTSEQRQNQLTNNSTDSNRIPRTLYRQLLEWCEATDQNVPLSGLVPPIHIRAPEQVDPFRMEVLAHRPPLAGLSSTATTTASAPAAATTGRDIDGGSTDASGTIQSDCVYEIVERARRLLPRKTELEPQSMTVPIHSSSDLKGFFQVIFRLNKGHADHDAAVAGDFDGAKTLMTTSSSTRNVVDNPEYLKQRISVAFEALKSLNQFTGVIEELKERRDAHIDRHNVEFRIGQVVQHRHDHWRGVVVGWERTGGGEERSETTSSTSGGQKTSLTTKDYAGQVEDDGIRYDCLLDEGDMHVLGTRREWATSQKANDLMPVSDKSLIRVRNHSLSEYFSRFDRATGIFVPNNLKAYKYPLDVINDDGVDVRTLQSVTDEERKLCEDVVLAVRKFAFQLQKYTMVDEGPSNNRRTGILANTRSRLSALVEGDVLSLRYKFASADDDVSPSVMAAHHIRALLNLCLEIFDVMFHRTNSRLHKGKLKFCLGDVVYHKLFKFRGVIVAWDPKPTVDVSRWDGLAHIANPMDLPFYHVVPDESDCIEAFGGERPMRYVCEENLEMCWEERRLLDVDLGPEWRQSESADASFIPPEDLQFKYDEAVDNEYDQTVERCMTKIQEAINTWQLEGRRNEANGGDCATASLSMSHMLQLLKIVDTLEDAIAVQELIKEMRKAHPQLDLRWRLEAGVTALLSGKTEDAMSLYQEVIDEMETTDDPYPEAYNKLATCQYMQGDTEKSLVSTNRVLELDPVHTQALNGLGMLSA